MSGHSKWKQIKHKKAVADSKRGAIFTRLAKAITLAAKEGGDPATNFKLATAIDQARAVNVPKENIERAIKRGTGEGNEAELHEVLYEGYGPGGVAMLVSAVTDNLNRTVSEVRHILQKHGGSLAEGGAVRWNFEQRGVIRLDKNQHDKESLELAAIDAGADDIREEEDGLVITTEPKNLERLKAELEKQGVKSEYAEIEYLPKNTVTLGGGDQAKLDALTGALDELEDMQDYYTNAI